MSRLLGGEGDVVFSSETALADALKFYGRPTARVHVLRFATVPEQSWYTNPRPTRVKYHVPEHYLIVCNQFWAHKGYETVFAAVSLLVREGVSVHVVCTGPTDDYRQPGFFDQILQHIERLRIGQNVSILGKIPRHDQMVLMHGASAVVQPSLFEGWSTVVEDARAVGTPVIASDLAVHREQRVPGAIYFRKQDGEDCARAITEHLGRTKWDVPSFDDQSERVSRYARAFVSIVVNPNASRYSPQALHQATRP
jgi:glycosyltransferase involved in cell wall biosynthesis